MHITERALRQIVREELHRSRGGGRRLREARITAESLPEGILVLLELKEGSTTIWVTARRLEGGWPAGQLQATRRHLTWPCRGAFEVTWSESSEPGLGPLLYDIAVEAAALLGGGLISDRAEVSPAARSVWRKYHTGRGDVHQLGLDSPENELTPDEGDNCDVDLAQEDSPRDWPRHPLAQAYRIEGAPTIKSLLARGRLKVNGSLPGIGV